MSLQSFSVLSGGTITPSGGTALAFKSAAPRGNEVNCYATADTDLRSRRSITCSVKEPKISASAPAGYTQARVGILYKAPLALDNGNTTVDTVKCEFAFDPETVDAEITEMQVLMAQFIVSSDFTDLIHSLSLN
jgi:hypothetical protein